MTVEKLRESLFQVKNQELTIADLREILFNKKDQEAKIEGVGLQNIINDWRLSR